MVDCTGATGLRVMGDEVGVGAALDGTDVGAEGALVAVGTLVDGTAVGLRVGEGVLAKADWNKY